MRRIVICVVSLLLVALAILLRSRLSDRDVPDTEDQHLAQAIVLRAERALDRADRAEARELIDEALAIDPDCQKACLYQGQFLSEEGDWEGAFRWWSRIPFEESPESGTARYLEGAAHLELDRAQSAESSLQAAIRMNPGFCAPYRKLAELYLVQLRGEEARETLRDARLRQCLDLEHLAAEILAGAPLIDESQAIDVLEEYVATDPNDTQSLVALARYQMLIGNSEAARQILEDSSQQHPVPNRQPAFLALMLCEEARFSEALDVVSASELTGNESLTFWLVHARLSAAANEPARAAAILEYIVSREPFNVPFRFELARNLSRAGQDAAAERTFGDSELLDRLERLAFLIRRGDDRETQLVVSTIMELEELLESLGQFEIAAGWLQEALSRDPRNSSLQQRLDRVLSHSYSENDEPRTEPPPMELVVRRGEFSFSDPIESGATAGTRGFRFAEVARDLGLNFRYFNGNSTQKLITATIGGGVAVLDYDGDGWPDLYFPQGATPDRPSDDSATDRLFRNLGGRQFVDVTRAAGLGDRRHTLSCTVGDVDSDGDPDLFLANLGLNALYLNNGDGTFSEIPDAVPDEERCSAACAFADFDADGLLDLYVVNYVEDWNRQCTNSRGEPATCDPQGLQPSADRLYRNTGGGEFVDVSTAASADISTGKGLGILVADLDGDRLVDVYVANDGTPNFLLRNESRAGEIRFTNIGYPSGTAVDHRGRTEAGMGIACSDLDNDGLFELFVTNFYRETNTLYHNIGRGLFEDMTRSTGLAEASRETLGFGTQAIDADLDGDDDLFIANGDIDDYSSYGRPWKMFPQAFRNDGGFRFTDVSESSGEYFVQRCLGRGMASLDIERDGRPDLVVVHHDRDVAVLRNETIPSGNWLALTLRGRQSNREGIGAVVVVENTGQGRVLSVKSGDGYGASNERTLLFSAGEQSRLPSLTVSWPSGYVDRFVDVPVNRQFYCLEGIGMRARAGREALTVTN